MDRLFVSVPEILCEAPNPQTVSIVGRFLVDLDLNLEIRKDGRGTIDPKYRNLSWVLDSAR